MHAGAAVARNGVAERAASDRRSIDTGAESARFWLTHAWLPALGCLFVLVLFSTTSLDTAIASRLFFDPVTSRWIGADTWWADDLIHAGGRNLMRIVATMAIAIWIVAWLHHRESSRAKVPPPRDWRAMAGYVALCMILTVAIAGLLKTTTNVDCPWDLSFYGGSNPYVHVFGDRPDDLARARCFPGAHSSSGVALLCLYFALRDRRPRLAVAGLLAAIALGAIFSFGQEARGAHFLSHDLTSAFLAWFVSLGLYTLWRRGAGLQSLLEG